jgi:ketosteroid isomerase-like protein
MIESNLEDRAMIHDLFTRYCCALDNGEIETVVDCFTADAILKSPVIDINGHDEIRAFAGLFAAQRTAGTQFRHMVSNIAMTITGNRAAATAYLLVLISKDGDHRSLPPGRYACELIKRGQRPMALLAPHRL